MPALTRFVVVRHGETLWNIEGRMQGHHDSPLSPQGEIQVHRVGAALAGEHFDRLVCSDLGRAMASARAIRGTRNLPIEFDAHLRERHLGSFQGLTLAQARDLQPEHAQRFSTRDPDHRVPGGESVSDLQARVRGCFERLAAQHAGACILVVTHGGVLDAIYRHVHGIALDRRRDFPLPNAAINRLEHGAGGWRVTVWADLDHLEGATAGDDRADAAR